MKLVKNILLIAAFILGIVFIKQKFFSKSEIESQTEQTAPEAKAPEATASEESTEATTTAEASDEQTATAASEEPVSTEAQ